MKRLLAFLLSVGAVAQVQGEIDRAKLIDLAASVLKVQVERMQGGYSLGSGVVIGPERVVTNCHVTRDARRIDVLHGGAQWRVPAQLHDAEHDLCLMRVPGLQAHVAAMAQADVLKPGQPVAALGYTGGMTIQYSAGDVVALHRLDGGRVIQSSNWFSSGASGGGLFDEKLNLVGILTFRLRGGESHYFAAPAAWLKTMLGVPAEDYSQIAPDQSQQLAYWQKPAGSQPRFLRAGSLERDGQWPALQALALEWVGADVHDPESWYFLAESLQRQDKPAAARHALECSLAIEPDLSMTHAPLDPWVGLSATTSPAPANASGAGWLDTGSIAVSPSTPGAAVPCTVGSAAEAMR